MHCGMDGKREKQIYGFKIRIGMITERGVPDIFCPSMSSRMARVNPKTFNSDILV